MWVLKREPGGMPEYMTLDGDYATGSTHAWSPDIRVACGFADARSASDFRKKFHHYFDRTVSVAELR